VVLPLVEIENTGSRVTVKLLSDPVRMAKLSENARELFEQRFKADVVYRQIVDHIEEVASKHEARA